MSLLLFALAAVTTTTDYDCTARQPSSLTFVGDELKIVKMQGGPSGSDSFAVKVNNTGLVGAVEVEIIWPDDKFRIQGKYTATRIGPRAIAFAADVRGNCHWTGGNCVIPMTFLDNGDGTAKIVIAPASLFWQSGGANAYLDLVVAQGLCKRKGAGR